MGKHFRQISIFLALGLSACASPEGEEWPTVSFGNDIAATEAALEKSPEVRLAPLPSLLPGEREGLSNPGAYLKAIEDDYRNISRNLEARFEDYSAARQDLGKTRGDDFMDAWLTAQMELSNISQYTEDLTKIRARIAALEKPLPEKARVLLARIEAQELQNRLYLRKEKIFLNSIEPG